MNKWTSFSPFGRGDMGKGNNGSSSPRCLLSSCQRGRRGKCGQMVHFVLRQMGERKQMGLMSQTEPIVSFVPFPKGTKRTKFVKLVQLSIGVQCVSFFPFVNCVLSPLPHLYPLERGTNMPLCPLCKLC